MSALPTVEDATQRVMTQPAITLSDLASLLGVSMPTLHRHLSKGALPVKTARIGQRWIVVSASVRELLDMGETVAVAS